MPEEPREVSANAISAFACALAEVLIDSGHLSKTTLRAKFLEHLVLTDQGNHAEAELRFMRTMGFGSTTEFRQAYETQLKLAATQGLNKPVQTV